MSILEYPVSCLAQRVALDIQFASHFLQGTSLFEQVLCPYDDFLVHHGAASSSARAIESANALFPGTPE